ncbi:MAG: M6 family metalloprotease domain-containing protein [Bacteroidales bacterium]|nr:M6 family metalloprotease domain-containing protein [Bacteroidales bacterium]
MKSANKFFSLLIIITFVCNSLFAIPADNTKVLTKKQSNGKIISYTLNGDEFISWATSLDGYTLLNNNKGDLVYAIKNREEELVPSDVLAANNIERTVEDNTFLLSIERGLFYSKNQLERIKLKRNERTINKTIDRIPTTGTPNFLVILVNYTDITFDTANIPIMKDQVRVANYTANNRTGSVKDYFFDNSMGNLNANFTVVGPYTLLNNQAYYGANDTYGTDLLPQMMIYDACVLANNDINFQDFDNDNDGIIDMIHVIYAGQGEHTGGGANAIWPHSWVLPPNTILDNVLLNSYSCSSELYDFLNCDGIGPICHEMGHVLGLPDFYDTDYSGSGGNAIEVENWDLMSSGSYNNNCITPPYLSTVERKLLGWINPILINDDTTNCVLSAISDSNMAYRINLQDNEFLIFEHRNKKKWDEYTPGKGMLVYHGDQTLIDNWIIGRNNAINTNPLNRGLFIIPSAGDSTDINSDSTTFPGSKNINYLSNINHKNGNPTGVSLSNIVYASDSSITFNLNNNFPNITIISPTNITTNSATLNGSAIGTDITTYGFEYRMAGNSSYTSQIISSPYMIFNLTNLLPGTTYEYRVFAIKDSITYYTSIIEFNTICLNNLSLPFNNGFEVATLPCWQQYSSNNNFISIVNAGTVPNCFPHSGNRMLKYGSAYLSSGSWATISTPEINIPHQYHQFSFWIYRNFGSYSSPNEGVEVYINSNNDLNGATLLGFISTDRTTPPIESQDGWYNYSYNLPAGTYGNRYFIIKTISDYGYNIFIDDISITQSLSQIPPMVFMDSISMSSSTTFYGTYIKGTDEILSKGFEYKTTTSATWDTIFSQTNDAHFSSSLTNLLQNTLYNVRAFTETQTEGITYSVIDTFLNQNLGINSIENNSLIMQFYPNPTTNITNLIIEGISDETKIIISDIQGRIINSLVANPINSKIIQKIDCSTLSKGVYFINIINSTINKTQKLMVK